MQRLHSLVVDGAVRVVHVRIGEVDERGGECALRALERTQRQAVVLYEAVDDELVVEEAVGARSLLGRQARLVLGHLPLNVVAVALARLGGLELGTVRDARAARVRVAGLGHLLEELRIGERRAHELVLLVHPALAVRVRPLVVLRVERTLQAYLDAEAGREKDGRRRQVVRIIGLIVHENVEATLTVLADGVAPVVGQAGVQLDLEREGRAGHVRLDERHRLVGPVEARVEAIAAAQRRMPDPLELRGVACAVAYLAADEVRVEIGEAPLVGFCQVRTSAVVVRLLDVEHDVERVRLVWRFRRVCCQLGAEFGGERVDWTYCHDGKSGLVVLGEASSRRHFVMEVLLDRAGDEHHADAERHDEQDRPSHFDHQIPRSDNVGQTVDLEKRRLVTKLLQPVLLLLLHIYVNFRIHVFSF